MKDVCLKCIGQNFLLACSKNLCHMQLKLYLICITYSRQESPVIDFFSSNSAKGESGDYLENIRLSGL